MRIRVHVTSHNRAVLLLFMPSQDELL